MKIEEINQIKGTITKELCKIVKRIGLDESVRLSGASKTTLMKIKRGQNVNIEILARVKNLLT